MGMRLFHTIKTFLTSRPAMTVSGTESGNGKLRLLRLKVSKNPGVKELVGRWDNR